jgi:hypothetical protein
MNNDIKHGLIIGTVFAGLVSAMPTKAQDSIPDDELCDKAVAYSVKYIPEENGGTLHQARWNILDGDRTDDMQKLLGLVVFEMGQRLSYMYREAEHGPADEWFPERIEIMREVCGEAVIEMRAGSGYGEFESANPDEGW